MTDDVLANILGEPTRGVAGKPLKVSENALPLLRNSLIDLYADPAVAAFRESLSNAFDSRSRLIDSQDSPPIEINMDRNIESRDTVVSIQDFGEGMSRETIEENYLSFGNSTKVGEVGQIGRYGFGAQAPLAASSNFRVVAVKDGLLNEFEVLRDIDDVYAEPVFNWSEECEAGPVPTDAPNGVKISYTLKDQYWFPAPQQLLGFPLGSIVINGSAHTSSVHNERLFSPVMRGGERIGWFSRKTSDVYSDVLPSNSNYVNVAGVIYPIDDTKVPGISTVMKRWKRAVVADVSASLVDMTPPRDSIRYTKKTIASLRAIFSAIDTSVDSMVRAEINSQSSVYEAVKLYRNYKKEFYTFDEQTPIRYRSYSDIESELREILSHIQLDESMIVGSYVREFNSRGGYKFQAVFAEVKTLTHLVDCIFDEPVFVCAGREVYKGYSKVRKDYLLLRLKMQIPEGISSDKLSKLHAVIMTNELRKATPFSTELFSGFKVIDPIIRQLRKEEREANQGEDTAPKIVKRRTAFVSIGLSDSDKNKYVLTPRYSTDWEEMGESYVWVSDVGATPTYSLSSFNGDPVEGEIRTLSPRLHTLLLKAEEEGRTVLIRKKTQKAFLNVDTVGVTLKDLEEYAESKVPARPEISRDFLRAVYLSYWVSSGKSENVSSIMSALFGYSEKGSGRFLQALPKIEHFVEKAPDLTLPEQLTELLDEARKAPSVVDQSDVVAWLQTMRESKTPRLSHRLSHPLDAYKYEKPDIIKGMMAEFDVLSSKYQLLVLGVQEYDNLIYRELPSDDIAEQISLIVKHLNR